MDCESPKLKFLMCFVSVVHVLIKVAHKPQTALKGLVSCFLHEKFIPNVMRFLWRLLTWWLAGAGWSFCGPYTSHASFTEEFLDSRTLSILTFHRDKILYIKIILNLSDFVFLTGEKGWNAAVVGNTRVCRYKVSQGSFQSNLQSFTFLHPCRLAVCLNER